MWKTLSSASVLLLFASTTVDNALRLAPADGLTLVKTQTFEGKIELVDQQVRINGETQDAESNATFGFTSRAVVHDTYTKTENGRIAVFERRYESIGADRTIEAPGVDLERQETSKLVGRTVRFTWDEGDEEYDSRFTEGTQDRELLDELRGPIDFEAFLPTRDVEEGASWNVALSNVSFAFDPFGELHTTSDEEDEDDDTWSELMDRALDDPRGRFVVTLVRNYSEGGVRFAELSVEIEAEGSSTKDEVQEAEGPFGSMETQLSRTAHLEVDLEGRLVWNKDQNHFHSYRLAGNVTIKHEESRSFSIMDQDVDLEITRELRGPIEIEVNVSGAD